MTDRSPERTRLLRVALIAFGIAFLLVYPLMVVWPSGWAWQPGQHEYEQMIVGIYATLGVFLLWASREPAHLSLIWFTVWSSAVHGGIMAVQAIVDPEHGHSRRRLGPVPGRHRARRPHSARGHDAFAPERGLTRVGGPAGR